MKIIKRTLYFIIKILDLVIPKNPNIWIFANSGHNSSWNGSHRELYSEVIKNSQIKCYVLSVNNSLNDILENHSISINSIKDIFTLLRSGVILLHHGLDDIYIDLYKIKQRKIFLLWHAIHIKNLSFTDYEYYNLKYQKKLKKEVSRYDVVFASSKFDKLSMSASFLKNPNEIVITGHPRNDILLKDEKKLDQHQIEELNVIRKIKKDKKLALYAPTWRSDNDDVYKFSKEDIEKLDCYLVQNNMILGIRGHYNSPINVKSQRIIDLGQDVISETQILLKETDLLISDYSGIWIDFLLLNRPIIGFCYDYDKYKKNRGFLFDFKKIFPGDIVSSIDELVNSMNSNLQLHEINKNTKYDFAKDMFHEFNDSKSSERILEVIYSIISQNKIPKKYL